MKFLVGIVFVLLVIAGAALHLNHAKKQQKKELLIRVGEQTTVAIEGYKGIDREKAEQALLDYANILIEVRTAGNFPFNPTSSLGLVYGRLALIELHRGNRGKALFWHTKALAKLNENRRREQQPALEMSLEQLATSTLRMDENMSPQWYSRTDFKFVVTNQVPQVEE